MGKFRSKAATTAAGAAAIGMAVTVGGVAATHPASISAPLVDLSALIVVGSSTHPDPTGNEDFFGGKFNQAPYNSGGQPGADLVGVDFRGGVGAIDAALQANSGEDNAVLSSGWGAANVSLLLNRLDRSADPALPKTVFILDNNVSRPDGGFGTRYPLFALIGVNPFPSRTDTTAAAVVDIAYQYNYNSNAPADLFNLVAHVNSLVAYLYGYREQSEIDLPVDVDGRPAVSCGGANTCAVLTGGEAVPCENARCAPPVGDRVVAYLTTRGNTTYVTYTTDELPLARLIRNVLGDAVADVSAPLLKVIVDSAYYDGNPIPSDPSRYRPARLMPSLGEIVSAAAKVPGAIREGLDTLSDNDSGHAPQESPTGQEVRASGVSDGHPVDHETPAVDEDDTFPVYEGTPAEPASEDADPEIVRRDEQSIEDDAVPVTGAGSDPETASDSIIEAESVTESGEAARPDTEATTGAADKTDTADGGSTA
ncbi:PE-PPE domain-containing protein [Mycobacterium sp. 4D054]|uniref:PE-PPE domain-containing protein n=1 Tax=Mycobacterium sp. 4D054 TaxID=3457440 RepID=UPI003FD3FBD7